MAKNIQHAKIVFPPGCKELTEDVGKDELIRRLKMLARAFQDMGQDENDSYTPLALHLATDSYMEHINKDVRLLTACCIADVFRIFAPEAPYKEQDQLKEIFMFFIMQLKGLEDPEAPSFKRYFYLLENLSWVKSFNICIELEESQEIFCSLFKLFFSIINEKHTNKVKTFMLDTMSPLICEADSVSQELMECILINMVDPNKTQRKIAYNMAKDLIKKTSSAIEPFIQAIFNNMVVLGKDSIDPSISNHMYDLIYELHHVSPSVLLSVIPQLEFKLKSNEESERKGVTKLLAKMFSEKDSDLAVQNRPLWLCFLGRFNDISVAIRTACIQQTQNFILNHKELEKDIIEQLKVRQHDPEESVRHDVVNSILNVAKKDMTALSPELLQFIKERTLDKRFKIRREALLGLGMMYKQYVLAKEPVDEHVKKVEFVKNKVFHHYYQNNIEDRMLVERMVNIYLVPYQMHVEDRMKKLLQLYSTLDEHGVKAFCEMLKHRNNVRQVVTQLLDAHDRAGEPNPPPIMPKLIQLGRTLPESLKPNEYVKKLNLMLKDDTRLRLLFKTLIGSSCTCKKAEDTVKEILKKIGSTSGTPNLLYQLVKSLLERIAPVMIDELAIDHLTLIVSTLVTNSLEEGFDGMDRSAVKGVQLLLTMSHYFPYNYKSVEIFDNFLLFVNCDDDDICDLGIQIFTNTGKSLHLDHTEVYNALIPVLIKFCKFGTPRQAKHALKCINTICINKEQAVTSIFEHIQGALDPENPNYLTAIVCLGHIAQNFPDLFASEIKSIVSKVIVKGLLMKDRTQIESSDEPWCPDHQLSEETQEKVQAMKMLVRWLLGLKANTGNSAQSTLRLLYTVIIHDGDLMENGNTNKPELARLRLQAGCSMLKLAEEPCYADIITREQFQALALMINDVCFQVRFRFANWLHKSLISLKLPLEYMSILSLGANDPIKERRQQIKQFLTLNINKRRDFIKQNPSARGRMFYFLPDYVVPYSVHLLAHDPDCKSYEDLDSLMNLKECLWFLLEPLTQRHEDYNYAFLRRMIENIKQTKDAQCPDDESANKKLYAVCDIAMGLLHVKTGNITLKEISQEPVLPGKLFTNPDKNYSNQQSYLPKDFPFDPKRRIAGSSNYQTADHKKSTAGSNSPTEIVVLSHAPVVNPFPYTPASQKLPAGRKRKHPGSEAQSIQESFDSGDSQSPKHSDQEDSCKKKKQQPAKGKKQAAAVKAPPTKRGRAKKVNYHEEDEEEEEEEEEEEHKPEKREKIKVVPPSKPKSEDTKKSAAQGKATLKQTKISDFSPENKRGASSSSSSSVKGGKKTLTNGARVKAATAASGKKTTAHNIKSSSSSSSSNASSPHSSSHVSSSSLTPRRDRKRTADSDDSGSSERGKLADGLPSPAVVKRLRPPTLREDISKRPNFSPDKVRSPSSSPVSASRPTNVIKSRPRNGRSATVSSSEEHSDRSQSPEEAPTRKGPVARPVPIKAVRTAGRRGSRFMNGTSDGEDAPETSQSSSSLQRAPVTKSITSSQEEDKNSDDDGINLKRRVRQRRK